MSKQAEENARKGLELYSELFGDKPVKDKTAAVTFVAAFVTAASVEPPLNSRGGGAGKVRDDQGQNNGQA